jgi:3-hydroxybutyryl-CoA dehydrogenase
MSTKPIDQAMVLGAGTMGAGIAEVCAKAGIETWLYDVHEPLVERGLEKIAASLKKAVERGKLTADAAEKVRARIHPVWTYEPASHMGLVIEAAPEDLALKKQIFTDLSHRAPDEAILASNTSSLAITEIARAATHPERVLGMHFFNPAPVMPLLEIVRAEQSSDAVVASARAFAERIGKTPIVVLDSPGFATSRLGVTLGLEAIRMLEAGVASAADIDKAMELGYKHPMGPLKLTDLVGLDVRLAVAEHMTRELGPQFTAPPLLRRMVRAGKLGKKTGEGFYRWVGDEAVPK